MVVRIVGGLVRLGNEAAGRGPSITSPIRLDSRLWTMSSSIGWR